MNYEVIPTPTFDKHVKRISKKYPSFKRDLGELIKQLESNPLIGDSLGDSCYKVRIAITGKPAGKSGGARVITHIKVVDRKVYLLYVYDKSYKGDLEENELAGMLKRLFG